ncbi:hypothetical protein [Actinoallomurus sp. CA-150999]|uniref:hypothetical protein n=1 Tax=Actinoallomurus sp. CA-150999 TaxID=3239887 RepID=UPI003D8AA355
MLWPDHRIDHVFSARPRRGGAGHPVHCEVIGTEPDDIAAAVDSLPPLWTPKSGASGHLHVHYDGKESTK